LRRFRPPFVWYGVNVDKTQILVVDDDRKIVNLVRAYLEKDGYRVSVAYDGLRALELARQEWPDLVVLDLMLPGMDGLNVCRTLRDEGNMVPIIMLTAKTTEADKLVGLDLGADDYVTKPFSPQELMARLTAVMRRVSEEKRAKGQALRYASELTESIGQQKELRTLLRVALEELEETQVSTMQALAAAVEARDPYTRGHCERVTQYALGIAEALAFSHQELEVLKRAAILHDIGKVAVPDNILRKKGRFNEDDWIEVRKHPEAGQMMLAHLTFLWPSLPLIRHHHERHDGSGYPDGLVADGIPLGARILAVADAFDAMTSDRPYREAFALPDALEELDRCTGSQFDPKIVKVFLEGLP
jgi:putative two-component system response regulator